MLQPYRFHNKAPPRPLPKNQNTQTVKVVKNHYHFYYSSKQTCNNDQGEHYSCKILHAKKALDKWQFNASGFFCLFSK